jgi:hypothetical protein
VRQEKKMRSRKFLHLEIKRIHLINKMRSKLLKGNCNKHYYPLLW